MTPQQRELLEQAADDLDTARLLFSHGRWRVAATRAYYVMFYGAEALLLGEGVAFTRHSAVWSAFGERFAKTGRVPTEYHRYLLRAAEVRHLADYATSPVSEEQASEQIARAERFLKLVEKLLGL